MADGRAARLRRRRRARAHGRRRARAAGSEEKPVGTVYIALARPDGTTDVKHRVFPGDRAQIQTLAAYAGLQLVREPARARRRAAERGRRAASTRVGRARMAGEARARRIRAFVALDLDATSLRRVVRLADRLRMGERRAERDVDAARQDARDAQVRRPSSPRERVGARSGKALARAGRGQAGAARRAPLRLDAFPSVEEARVVVAELVDAERGARRSSPRKVDKLAAQARRPKEDARLPPARDARAPEAPLRRAPVAARRSWPRSPGECRAREPHALPERAGARGLDVRAARAVCLRNRRRLVRRCRKTNAKPWTQVLCFSAGSGGAPLRPGMVRAFGSAVPFFDGARRLVPGG